MVIHTRLIIPNVRRLTHRLQSPNSAPFPIWWCCLSVCPQQYYAVNKVKEKRKRSVFTFLWHNIQNFWFQYYSSVFLFEVYKKGTMFDTNRANTTSRSQCIEHVQNAYNKRGTFFNRFLNGWEDDQYIFSAQLHENLLQKRIPKRE